jgi:hypothetical protein
MPTGTSYILGGDVGDGVDAVGLDPFGIPPLPGLLLNTGASVGNMNLPKNVTNRMRRRMLPHDIIANPIIKIGAFIPT